MFVFLFLSCSFCLLFVCLFVWRVARHHAVVVGVCFGAWHVFHLVPVVLFPLYSCSEPTRTLWVCGGGVVVLSFVCLVLRVSRYRTIPNDDSDWDVQPLWTLIGDVDPRRFWVIRHGTGSFAENIVGATRPSGECGSPTTCMTPTVGAFFLSWVPIVGVLCFVLLCFVFCLTNSLRSPRIWHGHCSLLGASCVCGVPTDWVMDTVWGRHVTVPRHSVLQTPHVTGPRTFRDSDAESEFGLSTSSDDEGSGSGDGDSAA